MEVLLIRLVIATVFGAICAAIANGKGRSVIGWFIGGFFLNLIAVIIVAVLPNLRERDAYRSSVARTNRRLREQLRQERIKGETFRKYANRRLDHHDSALALDTRADGEPRRQLAHHHAPPLPKPRRTWSYEQDGSALGPVEQGELERLFRNGSLTRATLVWSEGMADWQPAGRVPALRRIVS